MKRFIINFAIFSLIFFTSVVLLLLGTYYICSSVSYKIPESKCVIAAGHSHSECAIDDSIFSRAVNISSGSKAFMYSFVELRKFFEVNPHIKKALLSIHYESILKPADNGLTTDRVLSQHVPNHFSLLRKNEIAFFIDVNKKGFFGNVLKVPIKSIICIFKFITMKNITYKDLRFGGYGKRLDNKLDTAIKLWNNDNAAQAPQEYSQYQLEYLLKIVELCRENNVELILINTPVYNPEKYAGNAILEKFINNYLPETKYLDFSGFALPNDAYYDMTHLNDKGAKIFSRYIEDNYETIFEN